MKLPMLSKTWQHVESIPQEAIYGEISALSDTLSEIWMRSTVSTEPIKAREEGMYVPVFGRCRRGARKNFHANCNGDRRRRLPDRRRNSLVGSFGNHGLSLAKVLS